MKRLAVLVAAVLVSSAVLADPPTPPDPDDASLRYTAIGGGLYIEASNKPTTDGSSVTVAIYSRHGVSTGSTRFEFSRHDILAKEDGDSYKGGNLGGMLRLNYITVDCVKRTYQALDVVQYQEVVWKPIASLPVLGPVFKYACKAQ
jgi:hypothetical protein